MIFYYDTESTKSLATTVIDILREKAVYVTKDVDKQNTRWYWAYIDGDHIIRVFYNAYKNCSNDAVVDFYYKDPDAPDEVPGPAFNIDEEDNKRILNKLIRTLEFKALKHKIAVCFGLFQKR